SPAFADGGASMSAIPSASAGPRPRALAPDLARGTLLLVIALAHAQVLSAGPPGPGAPGAVVEHAVAALHTMFVDSRGYPMFAALFGHGVARLLQSDDADARRRLRRR